MRLQSHVSVSADDACVLGPWLALSAVYTECQIIVYYLHAPGLPSEPRPCPYPSGTRKGLSLQGTAPTRIPLRPGHADWATICGIESLHHLVAW